AGADDIACDHHRADADGAQAGRGQRILCAAGARHYRRFDGLSNADGIPGAGGICAGVCPQGGAMRAAAWMLLGAACGAAQTPLTLQEAEALAVKNHPAVSAALLSALAANQVTTEVKSAYFPTVTGNV